MVLIRLLFDYISVTKRHIGCLPHGGIQGLVRRVIGGTWGNNAAVGVVIAGSRVGTMAAAATNFNVISHQPTMTDLMMYGSATHPSILHSRVHIAVAFVLHRRLLLLLQRPHLPTHQQLAERTTARPEKLLPPPRLGTRPC